MSANKPLEVLVIEDDAQMQNILVASLDEFGVTAYVAGNMLDALALARLKKYDFYITDGCYPLAPGKGAEEACFKFYKELKKIPERIGINITEDSEIFPALTRKSLLPKRAQPTTKRLSLISPSPLRFSISFRISRACETVINLF